MVGQQGVSPVGWDGQQVEDRRARKFGRDMSMRAKRWSPARMELPTSKNDLEIGSKSKIR